MNDLFTEKDITKCVIAIEKTPWYKANKRDPVEVLNKWVAQFGSNIPPKIACAIAKTGVRFTDDIQLLLINSDPSIIYNITSPGNRVIVEAINRDGRAISLIDNPNEEIMIKAIHQDPLNIQYIKKPTLKIQAMAINENPDVVTFLVKDIIDNSLVELLCNYINSISFDAHKALLTSPNKEVWASRFNLIKGPNEIIQRLFVVARRDNIKYIENPSEEIQMCSIKRYSGEEYASYQNIEFINKPTITVQLEVVNNDYNSFRYIKNPAPEVQKAYINKNNSWNIYDFDNPIEEVQMIAVNKWAENIKHIKSPTEKVQLLAISKNSQLIKYISAPTHEALLLAVTSDPCSIEPLRNLSEDSQFEILRIDVFCIAHIHNPSQTALNYAIDKINEMTQEELIHRLKKNGDIVRYIKNPSNELQLTAIRQDFWSIKYIKNQTQEAKRQALESYYLLPYSKKHIISFIHEPDEDLYLFMVNKRSTDIRYIDNPSEKVQLASISNDNELCGSLEYIKNPTLKVQMAVLKKSKYGFGMSRIMNPFPEVQLAYINTVNLWSIENINNPTEEVQIRSLTIDASNIRYIKNPSEKMQVLAMSKSPNVIRFIDNPSEQIQTIAVKRDASAIQYINNPSENVKMAAVSKDADAIRLFDSPSEQLQIAAVNLTSSSIQYIKGPLEKVKMVAITTNPNAIQYIENPSDELQFKAVQSNPSSIQYIHNPSKKVKLLAVSSNPQTIQFIERPSEELQLLAVESSFSTIEYIKSPTDKIKLLAVTKDPASIKYFKRLTIDIITKETIFYLPYKDSIGTDIKNKIVDVVNGLEAEKRAALLRGNSIYIKHIINPTKNEQITAILSRSDYIQYIVNPSYEAKLLAVALDFNMINFTNDTNEEINDLAKNGLYWAISNKTNPSIMLQYFAVSQNPFWIKFIQAPIEIIQKTAFNKNTNAINCVKNEWIIENKEYRNAIQILCSGKMAMPNVGDIVKFDGCKYFVLSKEELKDDFRRTKSGHPYTYYNFSYGTISSTDICSRGFFSLYSWEQIPVYDKDEEMIRLQLLCSGKFSNGTKKYELVMSNVIVGKPKIKQEIVPIKSGVFKRDLDLNTMLLLAVNLD